MDDLDLAIYENTYNHVWQTIDQIKASILKVNSGITVKLITNRIRTLDDHGLLDKCTSQDGLRVMYHRSALFYRTYQKATFKGSNEACASKMLRRRWSKSGFEIAERNRLAIVA